MQRFQAAPTVQQKQASGRTTPTAPQAPKQAQPPVPKNAADAGQSAAKTPAPQQQIKVDATDPKFEAAARAALAAEAADSPVAAALQKEAARLGIPIVPQKGLKLAETLPDQNGNPTIYFNPFRKTDTTMSHEITHVIQMRAAQAYIKEVEATGKTPDGDDVKNAVKAGRDAVNKIVPVKYDKDPGQDYKENDAMRVANIVNAERTASEMKPLPEEQKTLEEYKRRRGLKDNATKHQSNDFPIPLGTESGSYDYQYVRDILGVDEKGQKKAKPVP